MHTEENYTKPEIQLYAVTAENAILGASNDYSCDIPDMDPETGDWE